MIKKIFILTFIFLFISNAVFSFEYKLELKDFNENNTEILINRMKALNIKKYQILKNIGIIIIETNTEINEDLLNNLLFKNVILKLTISDKIPEQINSSEDVIDLFKNSSDESINKNDDNNNKIVLNEYIDELKIVKDPFENKIIFIKLNNNGIDKFKQFTIENIKKSCIISINN